MRKIFCILLALVMIMGLCACEQKVHSSTGTNNGGNTAQNEISLSEPATEEKEQISKYVNAVYALKEYEETGNIPKYQSGEDVDCYVYENEALGYWYLDILNAECVDKWAGTEYTSADGINWNRQEILDTFVVIEGVKLYEQSYTIDPVGNRSNAYKGAQWWYNKDGLIEGMFENETWSSVFSDYAYSVQIDQNPSDIYYGTPLYIYDTTGKVIKCEYWNKDTEKYAVGEYSYADNRLTKIHIARADGVEYDITYHYDQNGRVTEIEAPDDNGIYGGVLIHSYSYNEKGFISEKVVSGYGGNRKKPSFKETTKYTYDENGIILTATYNYTEGDRCGYEDQLTYSYDEKGQMQTIRISQGDMVYIGSYKTGEVYKARKSTKVVDVIYGNYYIYKSAVEE